MKKLLGIALLSVSMMTFAVGCGDDVDTVDKGTNTDSSVETSSQSNTDGNKANTGKSEEPVKEEKKVVTGEPDKVEDKKEDTKEDNKSSDNSKNSDNSNTDNAYITEVAVYGVDDNFMELKRISKSIKVYDKKVAAAALEALKGSDWPAGYNSPIPEGVVFTSVTINDGIATVKYDYSGTPMGTSGETMFIDSVSSTLTEFPTISGVKFEASGQSLTTHMTDGNVYTKNASN